MSEKGAKWMEQSYYEGVPNSEVNWAELAQNWMAMRDAGRADGFTNVAPDLPPVPPPPPGPCRDLHAGNQPGLTNNDGTPFFSPVPFFPPMFPDSSGYGLPPSGWNPPPPGGFPSGMGPFPPFIPPHPSWAENAAVPGPISSDHSSPHPFTNDAEEEEEGGEYSHYYKEWDEKQKMEQRMNENEGEDGEGIPQGAMAHWMAPAAQWGSPPPEWMRSRCRGQPMHIPYIDQQTRKALPAWIREGLEKAEREKQKKLLKEAKLRLAEEAAKARRAAKGLGKFDSDSSDEESGNEFAKKRNGHASAGEPIFLRKREESANVRGAVQRKDDDIDWRTDEEKREDTLLLLRRLLTEVLLETTDCELGRVVRTQLEAAKRKHAQPKILAKSSALAALSSLGAGSDEESDEEGAAKNNSDAETDDERTPSPVTRASASSTEPVGEPFKAPLLILHVSDAKSKAKLSSHDDGNSSSQPPKGAEVVCSDSNNKDGNQVSRTQKKSSTDGSLITIGAASGKTTIEDCGVSSNKQNSEYDDSKTARRNKHSTKREGGRANNKRKEHRRSHRSSPEKHRSSSREKKTRKKHRSSTTSSETSSESTTSKSRSNTPERYRQNSRSPEKKKHSSRKRRSRSHDRFSRRSLGKRRSRSKEKRRSRSRSRHKKRSRRSSS